MTIVQAEEVINLLQEGDYQSVYNEWFSDELQASLSVEELENSWESQVQASGELIDVHSPEITKQSEDVDVIETEVEYRNVVFTVRMIFNVEQHLAGFHLSDQMVNASLPDQVVEEEIIVGEGTDFELNGKLTLPKENQENLPAAVLVHGSGPSDQDEAVYAYKPFRDIAWHLAEEEIAVVRYNKRTFTYGEKMAQDLSELTVYEETVEDAIRATELLRNDERIDENNVYLIGHSLGGMLAPRIDVQGGDFAGLVLLAGSPRPLWEIIYDQNHAVLQSTIIDEAAKEEQKEIVDQEYQKAQQLHELTDEEAKNTTVFGMSGYYLKEMDEYHAASIVSKLEKPILIMQGEDDFQVYYEKDFMAWKERLEDHENVTLISYPNLNHFFVDYSGPHEGTLKEYETPKQVDQEVMHDIGNWILDR
jgi:hypothetical protein